MSARNGGRPGLWVEHAERHLQHAHAEDIDPAVGSRGAPSANAEASDFARGDQVGDLIDQLWNDLLWIVQLVLVDVVGSEAAQAGVHRLADVLGGEVLPIVRRLAGRHA